MEDNGFGSASRDMNDRKGGGKRERWGRDPLTVAYGAGVENGVVVLVGDSSNVQLYNESTQVAMDQLRDKPTENTFVTCNFTSYFHILKHIYTFNIAILIVFFISFYNMMSFTLKFTFVIDLYLCFANIFL